MSPDFNYLVKQIEFAFNIADDRVKNICSG